MSKLAYFKLFLDDVDIVNCLSNEDFGKLIRMACQYIRTGNEPDLNGMMRIAFAVFKTKIDSQVETYNKKATTNQKIAKERNAPDGKSGATSGHNAPDGASISISISNKHKAISNKQEAKTEAEDKKSKGSPPISPPEGADGFGEPFQEEAPVPKEPSVYEERFGRFWEAYPKKIGKGAARNSFIKLKPSEALTEQMLGAIARAKQTAQWQKDRGQYIPNPATWLNQSRWEDNYEENAPVVRDYGTGSLEDWANV